MAWQTSKLSFVALLSTIFYYSPFPPPYRAAFTESSYWPSVTIMAMAMARPGFSIVQ